jgi:hypothetical protein
MFFSFQRMTRKRDRLLTCGVRHRWISRNAVRHKVYFLKLLNLNWGLKMKIKGKPHIFTLFGVSFCSCMRVKTARKAKVHATDPAAKGPSSPDRVAGV